jgi:HK97 family phage portal protein
LRILDKTLAWVGRKIFAATQKDKTGFFVEWVQGGRATTSEERVNNDKAFQLGTYFACIRNISEDIAKVPLKVYKQLKPRGKDARSDHRLYSLLHDAPNPEMTALTFRQTLTAHALGWGNGFAEIERDIEGNPLYLWPLRPDRVRVFRLDDNRIWYEIRTDDDKTAWLRDDFVFHVPGLGFDGLVGYNVARYARECLGAALAAQKFSSSFFGNGIQSAGILTHPGQLSPEAQANLRKSFEQYQGAENANKVLIIEEGLDYKKTTIPPEEAQFLESRQFSVAEICRWFRMPPHKVADLSRATFSNIEHQALEYVGDTLLPWFTRWEQEIYRKLLTRKEQRKGYFAKHVVQGLLRGDIEARNKAYQTGRNWGYLSADDIRELEDMNPLPDKKGETYLHPLNMEEAFAPGQKKEVQQVSFDKGFESFVDNAAERIANAETREISKVVGKAKEDRERFDNWIAEFFNKHTAFMTKALSPLSEAFWRVTQKDFYMAAIVEELKQEGIAAFTSYDPEQTLETWKTQRQGDIKTIIEEGMNNATSKTEKE